MASGEAVASALVTAFTTIVAVASPDRVVRVLRPALVALLEDEASTAPDTRRRYPGGKRADRVPCAGYPGAAPWVLT
jgi:hypothetical protein